MAEGEIKHIVDISIGASELKVPMSVGRECMLHVEVDERGASITIGDVVIHTDSRVFSLRLRAASDTAPKQDPEVKEAQEYGTIPASNKMPAIRVKKETLSIISEFGVESRMVKCVLAVLLDKASDGEIIAGEFLEKETHYKLSSILTFLNQLRSFMKRCGYKIVHTMTGKKSSFFLVPISKQA